MWFICLIHRLYHNQLAAIDALWRVLRGLRRNELKARVESHDYTNSQLYLATMFFAAMLFLLPTVLLYYVVFAFVRIMPAFQLYFYTQPVYFNLASILRVLCHLRADCHSATCADLSGVRNWQANCERSSQPEYACKISEHSCAHFHLKKSLRRRNGATHSPRYSQWSREHR